MIRIGIVEDDTEFAASLRNRLLAEERLEEELAIELYTNPKEFLEVFEQGKPFDICFSDIQMPEMDGLTLAQTIRAADSKVIVILLTSFTQYVYEGYKVFAFDYLLKSELDHTWDRFIGRLLRELKKRVENVYWIKHANGVERILVDDIIYISKYQNYAEFTLEGREETIKERKNMREIYQELEKYGHFVSVKKGCVINLKKISRMTAKEVKMVNGEILVVGRIYVENLRNKMFEYIDGEV